MGVGVGTGVGVGVGAGVGVGVGTGVGVGLGDGVGGGVGTGVGVTCRASVMLISPSPVAFGRAMAKKNKHPAINKKNSSHPTIAPALSFFRFLRTKISSRHHNAPARSPILKPNFPGNLGQRRAYALHIFGLDEAPLELIPIFLL